MSYMIKKGRYAGMLAKANNAGLVTTTGAAATDLIHTVPLGRSFYVVKMLWYQVTGANITMVFGTLSNAAIPAMVQMFPTQLAITGLVGGRTEEELVGVEFMLNSQALPNGWDGSLYVTSSAAGVELICEIAEKT